MARQDLAEAHKARPHFTCRSEGLSEFSRQSLVTKCPLNSVGLSLRPCFQTCTHQSPITRCLDLLHEPTQAAHSRPYLTMTSQAIQLDDYLFSKAHAKEKPLKPSDNQRRASSFQEGPIEASYTDPLTAHSDGHKWSISVSIRSICRSSSLRGWRLTPIW